jgi:iron(III) transport system permease protein
MRESFWQRFGTGVFLAALAFFFFCFLILPLGDIFVSSFWENGSFTWAYFAAVFKNQGVRESFLNSLAIGLAVTLLTTLLSLPLAYILTWLEFPLKRIFQGLILLPMVMPPFVGALGMRYLFARCGSVNIILSNLGLPSVDFLGGGGMAGVILLEALHLYPIMYLNVAASLASLDESLIEAARSAGAGTFTIWRKVILPLFLPGYFAGAIIVFIWAFTDLGTPLIFEFRNCLAVNVFDRVTDMHSNAAGYALVCVMLAFSCLFFLVSKNLSKGVRVISTSKGVQGGSAKKVSLKLLAAVYVFLIATSVLALLPHISVILVALSDKWFMTVLPESWTLKHFAGAFTHKLAVSGIRNSLFLSSFATLVDIFLGVALGALLAKRKGFWREAVDVLVMLPLAIPGIVLAFSYVSSFSGKTFPLLTLDPLKDPAALLIICYSIRRLPYIVRSVYAGFQHVGESMEEAGRSLGAGLFTVARRITLPLLSSHILAGAILTFAFCMFEVGATIILAAREWDYPISKTIYALNMRLGDGPCIASAMGVIGMVLLGSCLLLTAALLGRKMGEMFRGSSS